MPATAPEHPLRPLLAPRSVALVGASDRAGSVGRAVFQNLLAGGFRGPVYAVNPSHELVGGMRCYRSLADLPAPVDLAIVAAPARVVPGIVDDAARSGVRALAVISSGFAESGEAGAALEAGMVARAARAGIPLLGPNSVGLLRGPIGLNASFSRACAMPGRIAVVSQSGAICSSLVDRAAAGGIGLSSVISLGGAAALDFGDFLDFLRHDAETSAVLLYVEGVKHGRRFASALRALAWSKPVVVLKVGRHATGSRAARSHTGALAGNDKVFDAVLRRCGAVRVDAYEKLYSAARALMRLPGPIGNRVAVMSNGGGAGALAADAVPDAGLVLAELSPATKEQLDQALPRFWSHANPVDLVGDADGERFATALRALVADPNVDAVIAAYCPSGVSDPVEVASRMLPIATSTAKPVLTCWLGESRVREAREIAEHARLPAFGSAESAVDALGIAARWSASQRQMTVAPAAASFHEAGRAPAAALFKRVASEGRRVLTEVESKELLELAGIPVPPGAVARTREEAIAHAERIGYPVAVKILSRDITHKSDVQGVRLRLGDAAAVGWAFDAVVSNARRLRPDARIDGALVQRMVERENAREVLVGVSTDPVFGPVISFGAGGVAVELLDDTAVALPPLDAGLARDLVARTRVAKLLRAYRNVPAADEAAVIDVLLRVSDMVCELPWLAEMDINPLLTGAEGAMVLDARVVIDPSRPARDALWSHLAIHPYPAHLERAAALRDGTQVRLRAIRPEDGAAEAAFIAGLSDESRYRRFLSASRQDSAESVARFTNVDYDRDLALVAATPAPGEAIVGVARYVREADPARAEFAVVVADAWQARGVASLLMAELEARAREAGIERLAGIVLAGNRPMLDLMRRRGYRSSPVADDPSLLEFTLVLQRKEHP